MNTMDRENEQQKTVVAPQSLYEQLSVAKFSQYPYEKCSLGDEMAVVNEVIAGYWKPRFLLDDRNRMAFEFMNGHAVLQTVRQEDIDWNALLGLPDNVINRARNLDAWFPTFVGRYENGVAEVSWTLQPDGFYYRDEDGFGMTDDEEIKLYGLIDRAGKVVAKFYVK